MKIKYDRWLEAFWLFLMVLAPFVGFYSVYHPTAIFFSLLLFFIAIKGIKSDVM